MRYFGLLLSCLLIILAASCSSIQQTMVDDPSGDNDTEQKTEEGRDLSELLSATRNKLSDVYSSQQHDMPDSFLKRDTTNNEVEQDPFDGYRVQILSTREVVLADSVAKQFRMWADTTMTGYTPKAYVFFNQPFFKLHVGDFQSQQRAIQLSNILKQKYPEAWVVHDRIDPSLVPSDTTKISSN